MRIVTNADDFGICADTVRATVECLESGALTSASIMPKMPATELAVAYARANPDRAFGVHLTYATGTVEEPVLPPEKIPALVGDDGRFKEADTVRRLALLNRIPIDQIEAETTAQIGLLVDQGVRISHVDSHFHLHKLPPFREALRRVLPRFGIARVRNVQTVYTRRPLKSPTYWIGGIWGRAITRSFLTTRHFFMDPDPKREDGWPDLLLDKVREGTLEVGVHPGYAEDWRDKERQRISRFAENAILAGHELVPWHAI